MKTERAPRRDERGSILLHVMVTSVLVSIVAAGILRMSMLRYQLGHRSEVILQEKRDDSGALGGFIGVWNVNGQPCSGVPAAGTWGGGSCSNPGVCSCTCTQGAGANMQTMHAWVNGGNCQLDFTSRDLP